MKTCPRVLYCRWLGHPRIKYACTHTQYYITRRRDGRDACASVKSSQRCLPRGAAGDTAEEVKQMRELIMYNITTGPCECIRDPRNGRAEMTGTEIGTWHGTWIGGCMGLNA